MLSGISLSAGTRASLTSLRGLSDSIRTVQERLATGKRVSSPVDNPSSYFLAASLNARAAGLSTIMDAVSTSQATLDAASSGIKAIEGLLRSAQDLATQALTTPNTLVKVTGANASPLSTSSTIATTSGSSSRLRSGDTITVGDGTTTVTYTAANNDTVQTFLSAVNNNASLKVAASLNDSGQIQLQATGANNIVIGGTVNGGASTLLNATGLATGTTTFSASSARQGLAQQFDAIRTQIDQAVADAGVNGVNLLKGGTLSLSFNESGTSKLTVSGTTISASSLGLPTANSGSGGQFQTDAEINTTLASVAAALGSLQSQSAVLGSNKNVLAVRQDFSSAMADALTAGADALTASDTNADGALLLALQARQQIAATALSISSQQDQSALRLFGLS